MERLFWWIFVLGCVWILGAYVWGPSTAQQRTEGFQAAATTTTADPHPWTLHTQDRAARRLHSCKVRERFPDTETPNTWIEVVEDTCEDGLPHTSAADTIRIPVQVWETSQSRRDNVLRHERIHILQRRSPERWLAFYKSAWGYTLANTPPAQLPADVVAKVRGNPDTWPHPWACWQGRYWFLPLYKDPDQPQLRNTEVRVWDSETRTWCAPPLAWRVQFCRGAEQCPHQWEHPHEIAAEMWTDMSDWSTTSAGNQLKNFMQEQSTTTVRPPREISPDE